MAEANFSPAVAPGFLASQVDSGIREGQSMMQRASDLRNSRLIEQQRQQQIDQENILLPVKIATAQANIMQAQAAIGLATQQQAYRARAATVAPMANSEFQDAMHLADWDEQGAELGSLQAKYSWMQNLPEYQPFLKAIDNARANAVKRAITDQTLDAHMEQAQIMADQRRDVAETNASARIEATNAVVSGREAVANTNAGARIDSAKITSQSRAASSSANRDARATEDEFKAAQKSAVVADQNAAKASAAGDEANAALYRKHADEFRAQAAKVHAKPVEPTKFNVPNVTDQGDEAPAQEQEPRLYNPPAASGQAPSFSPEVKTPTDVLRATQQMVDDGVISPDQARETLRKLGFKPKGK